MNRLFKLKSCGPLQQIEKKDGTLLNKRMLILQELGGEHENQFVAMMTGSMADQNFYPGDVVIASLRFTISEKTPNEYSGETKMFQNIIVKEILKIKLS